MTAVFTLALRNIKVFTRNKTSVFFSFLSVLIIIALYALFLGKVQLDAIKESVGDVPGIGFLVDAWIMSGLLSINAVTIPLGVLGTMVYDIENRRFQDFVVAPISRTGVVISYLIAAWVIGFFLNLVAFVAAEIYIVWAGGSLLTPTRALITVGMLALII